MSIDQYIKKITPDVFNQADIGNRIDIWRVNINDIENNMLSLPVILSNDEVERVRKYRLNRDKVHFSISRTILRIILSSYLKKQPKDIIFSYTHTLKPVLSTQDEGRRVCFNVSHSNRLILYAVCCGDDIGIDVECASLISNSDVLTKRYFSSEEREYLSSVAQKKRQKEFTKIWVIKEAYLKAMAKSVSNIENTEVIIKKNKPPIFKYNKDVEDLNKLKICLFEPENDYIACVVYKQ